MKFPTNLRASLSLSMVALALLVALLAIGVHLGLAVHDIVQSSAERSKALAQQTAWLAGRAVAAPAPSAADAIRTDRALQALFESAVAGDPTIYDLAVVDASGRALIHSQPFKVGETLPRRPDVATLEEGDVLRQGARLLGPPRAYEARVPLVADGKRFGEVRIGVSTTLMKGELLGSLSAGLWVTAVALLLAILVALASAQLLSQRLRSMTSGLERMREGEFGVRVEVGGEDELALLASSINALGERLESTRRRAAAGDMDPVELLAATGQASVWARVVSGLTHELADALNAAKLNLQPLVAKWTDAPPEAVRHLRVLDQEFKRLVTILDRFRGFSVQGEMRSDWFDLRLLLEEETVRARERSGGRVEIQLEAGRAPERFWGDRSLLSQALTNLITNAVQAMPEGGRVTVSSERHDGTVAVTVSDEGTGIPEELQPQIFDVYFTTKPGGSGIGLAVVQQVVKLHRGRVRLRSKAGEGTQIVLELPERVLEPVEVA